MLNNECSCRHCASQIMIRCHSGSLSWHPPTVPAQRRHVHPTRSRLGSPLPLQYQAWLHQSMQSTTEDWTASCCPREQRDRAAAASLTSFPGACFGEGRRGMGCYGTQHDWRVSSGKVQALISRVPTYLPSLAHLTLCAACRSHSSNAAACCETSMQQWHHMVSHAKATRCQQAAPVVVDPNTVSDTARGSCFPFPHVTCALRSMTDNGRTSMQHSQHVPPSADKPSQKREHVTIQTQVHVHVRTQTGTLMHTCSTHTTSHTDCCIQPAT